MSGGENEKSRVIIGDLQGLADWVIGSDGTVYVDNQHTDEWERDKEKIHIRKSRD